MAINTGKVVVGGLAAGVVGNVLGYLTFGLWLAKRFEAEAVAVAPAVAGKGATGMAMATNIVSGFVIGILLVWLYAAMRPRFGPGPKTAMMAGLAVWICGFVFHLEWWTIGMMTPASYAMASVAAALQVFPSAWVGAMVYKEEGGGATM